MSNSVGNMVRVSATFRDRALRAAKDPTAIACKVRSPGGTEATYIYNADVSVVRDGVGVYHFDLYFTAVGTYAVRWVGTGAVAAAAEQSFVVTGSLFASP